MAAEPPPIAEFVERRNLSKLRRLDALYAGEFEGAALATINSPASGSAHDQETVDAIVSATRERLSMRACAQLQRRAKRLGAAPSSHTPTSLPSV